MTNLPPIPAGSPILLGTSNPAKQSELRLLLKGLALVLKSPSEVGLETPPEEEGETHQAIAIAKAVRWSERSGMLAIASDGGLAIPALGADWDSRYTHRFAGPGADDPQRVASLLELMQPYQGRDREASWVEAVALADRGSLLESWEVSGATGFIAEAPGALSETRGFWVFSLWYFPHLGKTWNQLALEERRGLNDHWQRLREQVQGFFTAA